jgi:hypothetical protein
LNEKEQEREDTAKLVDFVTTRIQGKTYPEWLDEKMSLEDILEKNADKDKLGPTYPEYYPWQREKKLIKRKIAMLNSAIEGHRYGRENMFFRNVPLAILVFSGLLVMLSSIMGAFFHRVAEELSPEGAALGGILFFVLALILIFVIIYSIKKPMLR